MRRKFIMLLALAVFISFSGCEQALKPRIRNIVCLIDFSNSVNHQKILEYADGLKGILSAMGPEDRLTVYPIDGGSMVDRTTIMYEDFKNADGVSGMTFKNLNLPDSISPPFKKKGEDAITASAKKPKRLNGYLNVISPMIVKRLDSLKKVRRKYGNLSDIFSAIYSVKDDFVKEDKPEWMPGERVVNYLVVFSDLVQESEVANFNTKKGIPESKFAPLISALKKDGLMCDLQQARVIVYDSFSNSYASSNSMAKLRIRNFWETYFADSLVNAYANRMHYQNSNNMDKLWSLFKNNELEYE